MDESGQDRQVALGRGARYARPSCGLLLDGLLITSASLSIWPSALASRPSTTSLMRCMVFSRLRRRVEGEVLVVPNDVCLE